MSNPFVGQYYLHTNGNLIYKRFPIDDPDSDFIVEIWDNWVIGRTPQSFLAFLIEARKKGAAYKEIKRLASHNRLDDFIPDWKQHFKDES